MVTSSLTVINAISTLSLSLCKCMLFLTVNYPNKSIRMIMRVGMAMINELENAARTACASHNTLNIHIIIIEYKNYYYKKRGM